MKPKVNRPYRCISCNEIMSMCSERPPYCDNCGKEGTMVRYKAKQEWKENPSAEQLVKGLEIDGIKFGMDVAK